MGLNFSSAVVWAVMIVFMLISFKLQIERTDIQVAIVKLTNLVAISTSDTLHVAVQFGQLGR